MPPRYAFWTIILDGVATAFRARDREDLLPTFKQLQRKNPDAVMKWFARGRLWDSPEAAADDGRREREQARRSRADGERRGPGWRPGGRHEDPRARFQRKKGKGPSIATPRPDGPPGEAGRAGEAARARDPEGGRGQSHAPAPARKPDRSPGSGRDSRSRPPRDSRPAGDRRPSWRRPEGQRGPDTRNNRPERPGPGAVKPTAVKPARKAQDRPGAGSPRAPEPPLSPGHPSVAESLPKSGQDPAAGRAGAPVKSHAVPEPPERSGERSGTGS